MGIINLGINSWGAFDNSPKKSKSKSEKDALEEMQDIYRKFQDDLQSGKLRRQVERYKKGFIG